MKRILQLKIILLVIMITFIPILLLSGVFFSKYNNLREKSSLLYIESIKRNIISVFQIKYDNLINSVERYSETASVILENNNRNNIKNIENSEKDIINKIVGIQNIFIMTPDNEVVYTKQEKREYENALKKIAAESINKGKYYFSSLKTETNYYQVLIYKIEKNEKVMGKIAVILNREFIQNETVENTKDAEISIYNENYELINSNTGKKILSLEINDYTKYALDGNTGVIRVDNTSASTGFVDLEGSPVYVVVTENINRYRSRDNFKLAFIIAIFISLLSSFLLGWKLIGTTDEYIDNSIDSNEFSDYTVKKFINDIDANLNSVNRVLDMNTDLQVLKQDMIKLRERFYRGKENENGEKKKL